MIFPAKCGAYLKNRLDVRKKDSIIVVFDKSCVSKNMFCNNLNN